MIIEKKIDVAVMVVTSLLCEMFLAYIIPNMGSYHRIRYPFFAFILGLGVLYFINIIGWRKVEKN
jgi:hypothetical protein